MRRKLLPTNLRLLSLSKVDILLLKLYAVGMEKKSTTKSTAYATVYVRRLGLHHFAHLRSVALGIDVQDSAKRYLGVEHGHQAKTAHRQVMDSVRSIARRQNDPAWRLIGIHIKAQGSGQRPSLDDFVAEKELDGFGETEVLEWYEEAYPTNPKAARRQRLQERQLATLKKMESLAAELPKSSDLVSGWFDDVTASKLVSAGIVTLGDLNTKIAVGGRWWRVLPAIGIHKANRIASHFSTLLPAATAPVKALFRLPAPAATSLLAIATLIESPATVPQMLPEGIRPTLLAAQTDNDAVGAWIAARAGSQPTATTYKREAHRLLLWLSYERSGKAFSQMSVEDCLGYLAFLQHIPQSWISRARASPGTPGWAPFRGQLSHKSQRQAVVIIASLFTWLQSARYITANPWALVNKKTGDDREDIMLDTKAISSGSMAEIYSFIDRQAPSPARTRIRFILEFLESVGLRSAELLVARLSDLRLEPEGWLMQVHGKGAKSRLAVVPPKAFAALQDYLFERGLSGIETAPPDAPLLVSVRDPVEPVGYQAFYEHVSGWLNKAVRSSALPSHERSKLFGASAHWLRHTFGTRAVALDVPLDVIQAQLGHASIQTTMSIYGRAPIRRRADALGKAFGN